MDEIAHFRLGHQVLRDLAELAKETGFKFRPDFELSFSCDRYGNIWNFNTFGYTQPNARNFITHPLLDKAFIEYSAIRDSSGRFHLSHSGAYWGLDKPHKRRFIKFDVDKDNPDTIEVLATLSPHLRNLDALKLKRLKG